MMITEFLDARQDEDEATARMATKGPWRYWRAPELDGNGLRFGSIEANWHDMPDGGTSYEDVASGYVYYVPGDTGQELDASILRPNDAEHIARHNPARVLVDIAAKRRIVELHTPDSEGNCETCGTGQRSWGPGDPGEFDPTPWPCRTIRVLASVYADHPDYRQEWRP